VTAEINLRCASSKHHKLFVEPLFAGSPKIDNVVRADRAAERILRIYIGVNCEPAVSPARTVPSPAESPSLIQRFGRAALTTYFCAAPRMKDVPSYQSFRATLGQVLII
jgi:hypothetical protein